MYASEVQGCFDTDYLDMWRSIAGHPERVVDGCLEHMRSLADGLDCEFVAEEEVGYEFLCGRHLSEDETHHLTMWKESEEEEWAGVRTRLNALHEEGNNRFDALDAKLIAKHICTGKRNIKSIFDYCKGGPEGNVQAYCVKCKRKVEILGTQLVSLKKHHLAMMGTCPECGTRVFRFISRRGLEGSG